MGTIMAHADTAVAYMLGDGPDMIHVGYRGKLADGRHAWNYVLYRNGAVVAHGADMYTREGEGGALAALASLTSFLTADAEKYARHMGRAIPEGEDGYMFGEDGAAWAYAHDDELTMILLDLGAE